MSDDPTGGNSATAVAEPASQVASGQTAPASSGTSDQNGQAATQAQSAPAEESFSSVDPNTLPPELQAVYKSMQSDYSKKTMSIADVRKKAEAYESLSKDPQLAEFNNWKTQKQRADYKEQKAEAEKRLGEKISDEEFTKAFNSKDDFLSFLEKAVQETSAQDKKQIQSLQEKLSLKDSQDLTSAFATEVGKDGKVLRPDFDDLEENNLISGFLAVNQPENKSAPAQLAKLNEAYAWAKSVSQKFYEKGKAEALQILQKKAANSSEPPTQAAKGAYTGPDPKKMSVREAMDLAKKGIRVPRDD